MLTQVEVCLENYPATILGWLKADTEQLRAADRISYALAERLGEYRVVHVPLRYLARDGRSWLSFCVDHKLYADVKKLAAFTPNQSA